MKFKDSYRKQNDEIHVRESLLDDIKAAEASQSSEGQSRKKQRRRQWLIAIPAVAVAAAACVAVGFGIGIGRNRASKASNGDIGMMTAESAVVAEASAAEANKAEETNGIDVLDSAVAATNPTVPEPVGSYEELGEAIEARRTSTRGYYNGWATDTAVYEEEPMAEAMPAPAEAASADANSVKTIGYDENGRSYSGTNNQVENIDEADIVKTDGNWIYTLNQNQNKVYILSAEGKDSEIVGTIKLREPKEKDTFWQYYSEMMLYGDRLYLLGNYNAWGENIKDIDRQYTIVDVYDIADRTAPKHLTTLKQQGYYQTARLVGDKLLVVSDYRIYYWYAVDPMPIIEYCPRVVTNDEATTLLPGDIYVNPESNETAFSVITTIDAENGTQFDSHKAVLGGCSQVYCNGTDLLIASDEYVSEQGEEQTDKDGKHYIKIISGTYTNLFRFTIEDGKIEAAASAKLPGTLLNQFSMDAYNGYYRLVVTRSDSEETIWTDGIDTYEWSSSSDCDLLVLDGSLNTVGRIANLAKDERVQSVRFMGDIAYFVTFRQVDPLFSADLSDPENPKILSTLKIPGFSAYMHPFGDGKLLGIGYDADEEHGWTENVKLSMFDVSDPTDVKEAFKLSVKGVNYTSVQYNHKIVFVDAETGTIAFPADNAYYVFRVEGDSFKQIGKIETDSEYWFGDGRGLFVEDAFYVIGMNEVTILSFETMEKLATIKLK